MNITNLNERGQEVLDSTPMAIPFGFERPPTLQEQIRRLMRVEYDRMRAVTGNEDFETPEEADDFDIGDDFDIDPVSGHEYVESEPPLEAPTGNLKEDFKTSEETPQEASSEAPSA